MFYQSGDGKENAYLNTGQNINSFTEKGGIEERYGTLHISVKKYHKTFTLVLRDQTATVEKSFVF